MTASNSVVMAYCGSLYGLTVSEASCKLTEARHTHCTANVHIPRGADMLLKAVSIADSVSAFLGIELMYVSHTFATGK